MNTPRTVDTIDWSRWVPTERAVLCFIRDGSRIMLIDKKTGLGAGKVNAPGGRIDKGESAADAAVRETREETGVVPGNVKKTGELFFEFTDGYLLHGTVFFATRFTGKPHETPEARPWWCDVDKIPYDRMWEDDQYWLPLALAGNFIRGYFVFDNDRMLGRRIETV